jgi:hypothetical protein
VSLDHVIEVILLTLGMKLSVLRAVEKAFGTRRGRLAALSIANVVGREAGGIIAGAGDEVDYYEGRRERCPRRITVDCICSLYGNVRRKLPTWSTR